MVNSLKELRKDIATSGHSASLVLTKYSARLIVKDETIFDQNMQVNVPQKRAMAAVLWHWLFDFPLPKGVAMRANWEGSPKRNDRIARRIEDKKNVLRSRVNPAVVIDAGSSTTIATERFFSSATNIPFLITDHKRSVPAYEEEVGAEKGRKGEKPLMVPFKRLIVPLFMTNSIVIADIIARSPFRHSVHVRIIGGTDRPERRSICGELSLLWLRACDQEGKMIAIDLAIIGATGLDSTRFDTSVLCCDSADEASLKSRLLAMSKFRIVLMDSEKLLKGGTNSMFAAASEGDIDLIITDQGSSREAEHAVAKLANMCDRNGVALLVADLSRQAKNQK